MKIDFALFSAVAASHFRAVSLQVRKEIHFLFLLINKMIIIIFKLCLVPEA
jgi:hypothetical protein